MPTNPNPLADCIDLATLAAAPFAPPSGTVRIYANNAGQLTIINSAGGSGTSSVRVISFVIDGGGVAPSTGAYGQLSIPFACTITGWVLTADQSGSAVIDVLRSTYAAFPSTASIAGSDKPTLSSVQKNQNLAVSAWTTAINAGDEIQINLNSVATCTRLNLGLNITVP
jgi:hypothetical protein